MVVYWVLMMEHSMDIYLVFLMVILDSDELGTTDGVELKLNGEVFGLMMVLLMVMQLEMEDVSDDVGEDVGVDFGEDGSENIHEERMAECISADNAGI